VDDARVGREFLHDMESVAIGSERRRVEGRCSRWSLWRLRSAADGGVWRAEGFLSRSMDHIWRVDTERRARSAFCQAVRGLAYMPSLFSHFAKLSKMQNHWITPFCNFWLITRMQSLNAKPLNTTHYKHSVIYISRNCFSSSYRHTVNLLRRH